MKKCNEKGSFVFPERERVGENSGLKGLMRVEILKKTKEYIYLSFFKKNERRETS